MRIFYYKKSVSMSQESYPLTKKALVQGDKNAYCAVKFSPKYEIIS